MVKSKHFWFFLLKWLLVLLLSYYIYDILSSDKQGFRESLLFIKNRFSSHTFVLSLILLLSVLNWFIEIIKWQKLIFTLKKISFSEAFVQTLSAHSLSLVTPFKSGDYAFKTLFFEKEKTRLIISLNAFGNFSQLLMTTLFGSIGFLVVFINFNELSSVNLYKFLSLVTFGIATLLLVVYYIRKKEFLRNWKSKLTFISKKTAKEVLVLSLFRYLVFSHQYYFILLFFGIEFPYFILLTLIFSMYLISSLLPIFNLFDFVIKGSVAVFLFSKFGIDETIILTTSTLMWLLNFLLPALIGVLIILRFKKEQIVLKLKNQML